MEATTLIPILAVVLLFACVYLYNRQEKNEQYFVSAFGFEPYPITPEKILDVEKQIQTAKQTISSLTQKLGPTQTVEDLIQQNYLKVHTARKAGYDV